MTEGVRPTKRCLDQLGVRAPAFDVALDLIEAEPVPHAQAMPERFAAGGVERVKSLRDRVWFKLKTSRWRGAVTRLTDQDLADEQRLDALNGNEARVTEAHRWWLGAVGRREAGSRGDFYAAIEAEHRCSKSHEHPHGVDTRTLLPQEWDRKRLAAENAYREVMVYQQVMREATARSIRCGEVVTASFGEMSMGALVRADRGEQFVAFIAHNVFDPKRLAVMMNSLPGIAAADWGPEPGGIADLKPQTGDIVWSAILPHEVAEQILDLVPWRD